MPKKTDRDVRLRISPGCLKNKVSPEADDLLRRILEIEDSAAKTDVLRALMADSLNQIYHGDSPSFARFAIQNALGERMPAPAAAASPPAQVEPETVKNSIPESRGDVSTKPFTAGSGTPSRPVAPGAISTEDPEADNEEGSAWNPNPALAHLMV
jgi:hypothetical protein